MEHRGEAIERRSLFSQVWETNYTDDTRTLDVHISWLRRAIEEDPLHPKYLKTVRGVGYRLDI
jgi:DNA-binding response OmpR family regulator